MSGSYIGIACWTFNRTPELDLSVDAHPNNAWINGGVDDLRIYRRALTPQEIATLYYSFDREAPAAPPNVVARAESSSQISLRWGAAEDSFGVAGYRVFRDGVLLGTTTNVFYLDEGLSTGEIYTYTIEAYDFMERTSVKTPTVQAATLSLAGQTEIVVDDNDPSPFLNRTEGWVFSTQAGGFWGKGFLHDGGMNKGGKTISFSPSLPEAGLYDVALRWVARSDRSTNTPVTIEAAETTNTIYLNQRNSNNTWVSVGKFSFGAGQSGRVTVRTEGTSGLVVADAVRWSK